MRFTIAPYSSNPAQFASLIAPYTFYTVIPAKAGIQ